MISQSGVGSTTNTKLPHSPPVKGGNYIYSEMNMTSSFSSQPPQPPPTTTKKLLMSPPIKVQMIENRTKELQEDIKRKVIGLQEARLAAADAKEVARIKALEEKEKVVAEKRNMMTLNAELDKLERQVSVRLCRALERDAFFAKETARDYLQMVQEGYDMATYLWGVETARQLPVMSLVLDARDRLKRLESAWKLTVEDVRNHARAMARRPKDSRFRSLENLVELKTARVEDMQRKLAAVEESYQRAELDLVLTRRDRVLAERVSLQREVTEQEHAVLAAGAAIEEARAAEESAQLDAQAASDLLRLAQEAANRERRREARIESLETEAVLEQRRVASRSAKSSLKAAQSELSRLQSEHTQRLGVAEALTAELEELLRRRHGGVYTGDYRGNDRHGHGRCVYTDGSAYSGDWADDLYHGYGEFICPDGSALVAEWECGHAVGTGSYSFLYGVFDLQCDVAIDGGGNSGGNGSWRPDERVGSGEYMDPATRERYRGQWRGNLREGRGKLAYPSGDEYDGQWHADQRSGHGRLVSARGTVYEGEWLEDQRHGHGTLTTPPNLAGGSSSSSSSNSSSSSSSSGTSDTSGSGVVKATNGNEAQYTGGWVRDQRHSGAGRQGGTQAKVSYHNGDTYIGEYLADQRHGQGTWTYVDGARYSGEWVEGKKSGQGTLTYANGNVYCGSWSGDRRNGRGCHRWKDGSEYRGDWREALREGRGRHVYADGSVYDGEWLGGKRHGRGKFTAAHCHNGHNCGGGSCCCWYDGEWMANARHGRGRQVYAHGHIYDGEWRGGKRHGVGFYQYDTGNTYNGQWVDDEINGQGTCESAATTATATATAATAGAAAGGGGDEEGNGASRVVVTGNCRVPRGTGTGNTSGIVYADKEVSESEWMGAIEV